MTTFFNEEYLEQIKRQAVTEYIVSQALKSSKIEQTNEDWLKTLNTEKLAEEILQNQCSMCYQTEDCKFFEYRADCLIEIIKWLKEKRVNNG